jgi:hypothetical protein
LLIEEKACLLEVTVVAAEDVSDFLLSVLNMITNPATDL